EPSTWMPPCSARPMMQATFEDPTSSAATMPLRAWPLRTPLALALLLVRNVSPIARSSSYLSAPFPGDRGRITIAQSKHIIVGIAKIDRLDIALENAFFDNELFQFRKLPLPAVFGQPDGHTARQQQVPTASGDPFKCGKPRLHGFLAGNRIN